NSKLENKNVVAYGIIVVASILLLTATVSSAVLAQTSSAGSKNATTATTSPNQRNLPNASTVNITGSIPLGPTISGAIYSKVKTTLSDAVTIAQKAVGSNTSATLAFIRPLNGYLVYDVHVKNNSNNTSYAVIVDPGNGKVLYKQTPPSLVFGFGHHGMFGKGKMGPFFGGYGGSGRGFGDHGSMMTGPRQMGPMGSSVPSR
ncbi:MAG: PepSY domain-containing protein, partial [Nitrososphaeraceae archaeon]